MPTPDTSRDEQYLTTNRALLDPVVAAATSHLGATGRAVDLGTGAGGALPHLARTSRRVTGVDLQEAALDLARRHVEGAGWRGAPGLASGTPRLCAGGRGDPSVAVAVGTPLLECPRRHSISSATSVGRGHGGRPGRCVTTTELLEQWSNGHPSRDSCRLLRVSEPSCPSSCELVT